MDLDLEMRVCGVGDAPVVAALVGGFRDHLGESTPTDAELAEFVTVCLADPTAEFCAAWRDGTAVGYTYSRFFTSLWSLGVEAHLEDLFVFESERRRSVGRELLRFAVERATERGAKLLALNTNERNANAHRLYRSEGFAPQTHSLWTDGHEVRWVRRLDANAGVAT